MIRTEHIKVKGGQLVEKLNELAKESNIRKVIIHDHKNRHVMTFPMNLGIATAVIVPILAVAGLMAFLVYDLKVIIEKNEEGN
jgi:hypothetical protein